VTDLVLSPHYGASKIHWCLKHLPNVDQVQKESRLACGLLSSYILFKLLEEQPFFIDPANASQTLLWDCLSRDWSTELFSLFDIPIDVLPAYVNSQYGYGHMQFDSCSIPVSVTTGDQSAALYAFGQLDPKTIYINVNTGASLQRATGSEAIASERLLYSVIWQSEKDLTYVMEETVNGAGSALQLISNELGISKQDTYAELKRSFELKSNQSLFLNSVSGLWSPFWLANFPSRFTLEGSYQKKLLTVLESIIFLIQTNLDEISLYTTLPGKIIITGGLAVVDHLCHELANISGLVVEWPELEGVTGCGLFYLLTQETKSCIYTTYRYSLPSDGRCSDTK